MQLAAEVARLADAAERLLEVEQRRERVARDELAREREYPAPERVGLGLFLRSIPGLAARFERVVPDEFVVQTGEGELEVACPCGETPVVTPGKLVSCRCERWFLYDGRAVHVARAEDEDQAPAVPAP